jgi:PAS domain S-box-containing protein
MLAPQGWVVQHHATHARKDDGESNRVSPPLKHVTTAWRSLPGLRGGIGLRLLVRVLLFSSVITLLLTLAQLYLDYRRDVGAIDQRMSEIDSGYRRSLGEGLWRLDARQLQLQAEGILRLPEISYVELREATNRAAPLVVTAGSRQANPATRREFRIYYTNHGAEQLVGILVVEATFDRIYSQLFGTAAVILVGQAITTFIVSFFILLIVHQLITRHLTAIATSIRGYDFRGSQAPLRLDRRRPVDELDRLVDAFNDMYTRLQAAYGDLAEREKQQTAIAEMLRVISSSPIESVLEAVAENAARLSDANNTEIFRLEGNLLRLVASYGEIPVVIHAYQGVVVNRDTVTGRAACEGRTVHVRDLAAEEGEYPVGSSNAKREGHHTTLGTPLLREGIPIGIILVRRREVRPFSDKQIALIETFADQVVVAIENARLFEAEKQRTLALAVANRDLAEREAKIRRFVDANIIGIFVWDLEGRMINANEAFLRMVGYDREDLVSGRMRWPSLTPAELHASDERTLAELKATGTVQPCEREYLRKDGGRVPVLMGSTLFEESGNEGLAFVLDLTERKRAEEALRESEAKFRDYAESASDWYWETDPDHKFARVTDYERLLAHGFTPVSRIGLARWEFATDVESEPEKWELHRSMLEARQPFRDFVYRATRGDGSLVYYKIGGKPVFDANGEFRGYRGTGTDVTALRTVEAEARENERRYREAQLELAHANRVATVGQLTASIAHEVNQPITAAVTYASAARRLLSAESPNLHEVDDVLSLIVKEGNRAGEVVGRIRALIKKAPARKDAVEINDAILEVIALTRTEAANNGVSVRTQLAEGLPRVQGDRVQLQQVLLNLIFNAIEAMRDVGEEERELLISSRNEPDGVLVEVRDSGPGFAPADIDRVFEAFYSMKPSGLGLGLSICRSIIEAHNGRLWASPNLPRGAVFGFIAPAHPAAAL